MTMLHSVSGCLLGVFSLSVFTGSGKKEPFSASSCAIRMRDAGASPQPGVPLVQTLQALLQPSSPAGSTHSSGTWSFSRHSNSLCKREPFWLLPQSRESWGSCPEFTHHHFCTPQSFSHFSRLQCSLSSPRLRPHWVTVDARPSSPCATAPTLRGTHECRWQSQPARATSTSPFPPFLQGEPPHSPTSRLPFPGNSIKDALGSDSLE